MTTWFPTAVADFLSFLLCHDKICFAAKLIPLCKPFSPISDVFASHIANLCIFFCFLVQRFICISFKQQIYCL